MSTAAKRLIVDQVKQDIARSEAVFFVNFNGLPISEERLFRDKAREARAKVKVVKINLARIALKSYLEDKSADVATVDSKLDGIVGGKLALVFSNEDAQNVAKSMSWFQRESEKDGFILGGFYKGEEVWGPSRIKSVAKYPDKKGAIQILAFMLSSPLSSLARAIREVAAKK